MGDATQEWRGIPRLLVPGGRESLSSKIPAACVVVGACSGGCNETHRSSDLGGSAGYYTGHFRYPAGFRMDPGGHRSEYAGHPALADTQCHRVYPGEGGTFLALCYILFALGALLHQRWAWGLGLRISLVTGLVVVSLMLKGAADLWSLLWLIVPVILAWYLLSPVGRQEFRR
jgi:hypothetical protein